MVGKGGGMFFSDTVPASVKVFSIIPRRTTSPATTTQKSPPEVEVVLLPKPVRFL